MAEVLNIELTTKLNDRALLKAKLAWLNEGTEPDVEEIAKCKAKLAKLESEIAVMYSTRRW